MPGPSPTPAGPAAPASAAHVRPVPAGPLAGEQVGVHRLLEQGVTEGVPLPLRPQHLRVDRLPQGLVQGRPVEPAHREQEVVGHASPAHRGEPGHLARGRAEPLQPVEQHLGQPVGHAGAVPGGEELLGEVRVALGAGQDPAHDRGRDRPAGQGGEERGHALGVERGQLHPADVGQPRQVAQQAADRVGPVQVVAAVAGHDQDALPAHPAQEVPEQVTAGGVGPVQVLQDQQDGGRRRERPDVPRHLLEQLHPPHLDRGGLRRAVVAVAAVSRGPLPARVAEQGGEPGGHGRAGRGQVRAEGLGEGQVRQARRAEVDAVPAQDGDALAGGGLGEGLQDTGLAGAGVPGEQDRPGPAVARVGERVGQGPELGPAADEGGVDAQPGHGVMVAAATDRMHVSPAARALGTGARRGHQALRDGATGPAWWCRGSRGQDEVVRPGAAAAAEPAHPADEAAGGGDVGGEALAAVGELGVEKTRHRGAVDHDDLLVVPVGWSSGSLQGRPEAGAAPSAGHAGTDGIRPVDGLRGRAGRLRGRAGRLRGPGSSSEGPAAGGLRGAR